MNIIIINSHIQFKNPQTGQASKAIEEHYHGRRIIASVDGSEEQFMFTPNELEFEATTQDMMLAIENRILDEQQLEDDPEEE